LSEKKRRKGEEAIIKYLLFSFCPVDKTHFGLAIIETSIEIISSYSLNISR